VKIQTLKVRNYRTLEDVKLSFPSFYCAISGKNDSGKTNVFRVLRALFRYQPIPYIRFGPEDESRISVKDDFPVGWLRILQKNQ
jgi:putative ATP-dependent endonuclease of OLD family